MSGAVKKEDGLFHISWEDYKKVHKDYKGKWDKDVDPKFAGKRNMLVYDNGTCLITEGLTLVIDGAPKKKEKK